LHLRRVTAGAKEAAEAVPTESGVAGPVGFMHPHSSIIDFVYSLKHSFQRMLL
jgi:hypothetical protein